MATLQYSKQQVLDMLKKKAARDILNSCALRHWDNQTISLKNSKSFILYSTNIEKINAVSDKEGNINGYHVIVFYPEKQSYYVKADKVLHEFRANVELFRKENSEKIDTLFEDLETKLNKVLKNRDVELNDFCDYTF